MVITPRNRLHSTAMPKPSTLVHICIIISTFSFSVLLKIIVEFMTLVTGDQQPSPLWTFHRDEKQIWAAFLATPICVLHPWLLTFCWRTPGLCAQWKCQLLTEARGAACGALEEVRRCFANLSLLTQQLRYECNKEKQTAREPAHVRYATERSFQRIISIHFSLRCTWARGLKPTDWAHSIWIRKILPCHTSCKYIARLCPYHRSPYLSSCDRSPQFPAAQKKEPPWKWSNRSIYATLPHEAVTSTPFNSHSEKNGQDKFVVLIVTEWFFCCLFASCLVALSVSAYWCRIFSDCKTSP